jgi:hypothetical protein
MMMISYYHYDLRPHHQIGERTDAFFTIIMVVVRGYYHNKQGGGARPEECMLLDFFSGDHDEIYFSD